MVVVSIVTGYLVRFIGIRQSAQCNTHTSRTGHHGQRLYQEATCVPAANCRPGRVSIPDRRFRGAALMGRDY